MSAASDFRPEFLAPYGFTRLLSAEPHVCSRCCHDIDDDICPVPLMLFGEGERAWVYCDGCAGLLLGRMLAPKPAAAASEGHDAQS